MDLKNTVIVVALVVSPSLALAEGTQSFDQGMQPILQSYLKIQDSLAGDKTSGVQQAAKDIAKNAKKLDVSKIASEHAKHYKDMPTTLRKAAEQLSKAKNLAGAREAFKDLSKPMAMWATMSKPKGVIVAFCSMVKASWLQKKGDIRNPYYGASMLSCGEVVGGDSGDTKPHGGMDHGDMQHGDMKHDMHSGH